MTDRPTLSVVRIGPGATIQDAGRFGLLRFGVTPAGPMDPEAHAVANLALGNPPGAACLEIGPGGVGLRCDIALPLAFAGGAFRWTRDELLLPAAARVTLRPDETLQARAGPSGTWCYLAVSGGFDVPEVLGSRATHLRSRLGGLEGRMIVAGDRLVVSGHPTSLDDAEIDVAWPDPSGAPIRVLLGPQDDHFTVRAIDNFLADSWTLTGTADRMAYGFTGPALTHSGDFNIVSDGVALGAVQVAGDGQPLVLMADRQPTGGYPKIAHVARADIGRLAQLRPGQSCRFEAISAGVARQAHEVLHAGLLTMRLRPLRRAPTSCLLTESNLIDGVTDGLD